MNLQDLQKGVYTPFHLDGVPNERHFALPELIAKLRDRQIIGAFGDKVPVSWEEYSDIIYYLYNLKCVSEEPPLGKKSEYVPLGFHELAEMIGEPIYIKPDGCKGHWEILASVRRNIDGDCFTYRGFDREIRLTDEIYRSKKGAEENG